MDMDSTIQGLLMTEQEMEKIVREILAIDVGDGTAVQEDDEFYVIKNDGGKIDFSLTGSSS